MLSKAIRASRAVRTSSWLAFGGGEGEISMTPGAFEMHRVGLRELSPHQELVEKTKDVPEAARWGGTLQLQEMTRDAMVLEATIAALSAIENNQHFLAQARAPARPAPPHPRG